MERKRSLNSVAVMLALSIISLFTIVYIITDFQRPGYYSLLWLLPLSFLVAAALFVFKWYKLYFSSITGTIAILTYFARMVITPLFMSLGNYESVISESTFSINAPMAIVLMAYETMFVFLLLTIFIQKSNCLSNKMQYPEEGVLLEKTTKPSLALWFIIAGMSTFIVSLIVMDPTIWKANFLLLIDINQTYHALSSANTGIGTLSMYVELMNSMFKLIQVMLPPMLLYYIARRKGNLTKYTTVFALFLLVVIVATDDRIDAIFAGIAFLFTVKDTFGVKFRHRFSRWLLIIFVAGLFGLSIKSGVVTSGSNDADLRNASKMLVAYFSGVPTVAAGIGMAQSLGGINLFRIIPDAVSKVPYFAYAVNLFTGVTITNSNQLLNNYITNIVGRGFGQILPSIAVGYEYVGFVLAPLIPAIFLKLALYFERNIKKQGDIVRRNLYYWITICVASSPVISSVLLITAKLAWFMIAIVIMAFLQKERERIAHRKERSVYNAERKI